MIFLKIINLFFWLFTVKNVQFELSFAPGRRTEVSEGHDGHHIHRTSFDNRRESMLGSFVSKQMIMVCLCFHYYLF